MDIILRIKNKIRFKKARLSNYKSSLKMSQQYNQINQLLMNSVVRSKETKIAVVVHLFYEESWILIEKKLKNLSIPFDLFISIPSSNTRIINNIKKKYQLAYIYITPNKGRDVLPFVKILPIINDKGYSYVLKLHSKKSTHRVDGQEWMTNMISSLLPDKKQVLDDLLSILEKKSTGIIGPEDQYISLIVNFQANGTLMTKTLKIIYKNRKKVFNILQKNRKNYGFFAGTMFWIRLDNFKSIINYNFKLSDFELENGQIDGTFAHALERVFCLIHEINGKKIYEISPSSIKSIGYKTTNIPDWANVQIKK